MDNFIGEPGRLRTLSWTCVSGRQIVFEASDDPEGPILGEFYQGYDEAFALPNEKEELAGFKECLALNYGPSYAALSQIYGPFREVVLTVRDGSSGRQIGGANFIAFPLPAATPVFSVNLNYVYIYPEWRRQGYLAELVKALHPIAADFFNKEAAALPFLLFIEQNDPTQMSVQDYERDTDHSGLDQMRRIQIWSKLGARIIDFAYIQPALSKEQQPDTNLLYAVLGAKEDALSACLFLEHLKRFFAISVLKGGAPELDTSASAQIDVLGGYCTEGKEIPLLQTIGLTKNDGSFVKHNAGKGLRALLRG